MPVLSPRRCSITPSGPVMPSAANNEHSTAWDATIALALALELASCPARTTASVLPCRRQRGGMGKLLRVQSHQSAGYQRRRQCRCGGVIPGGASWNDVLHAAVNLVTTATLAITLSPEARNFSPTESATAILS